MGDAAGFSTAVETKHSFSRRSRQTAIGIRGPKEKPTMRI